MFWVTRNDWLHYTTNVQVGMYCLWYKDKPILATIDLVHQCYESSSAPIRCWSEEDWPFDWKLDPGEIVEVVITPRRKESD